MTSDDRVLWRPDHPPSGVDRTRGMSSRLAATLIAASTGVLAAIAALAAGHLVAAVIAPAASPLLVVGSALIDLAPQPLKAFAIATFGDRDKDALLAGLGGALLLAAAGVGIVARDQPRLGRVAVGGLGVVGSIAALSRPAASPAVVIPSVVAGIVGVLVLEGLRRVMARPVRKPGHAASRSRRGFLVAGLGVIGLSALSGGAGIVLADRRRSAVKSVELPTPMDPAPPLPTGVELGIDGISPFRTPLDAFYRVDTALDIPVVDAATWSLRIHGLVDREVTLTLAELLELPTIERDITLACVSNPVGGPYVGHARWLGVPLATVLDLAGVQDGADQLVSRSIDGMTIGTPVAVVRDGRDAMLAVGMGGAPLPPVHGFPVRMVVPGLYGYVSATKWLVELELTTFDAYDPYWVQRGWAAEAPIRTMARIDTPKPLARLAAGPVVIGGVAWAQHRGVEGVEVSIDEGPWLAATLAADAGIDTWRQWMLSWEATSGRHRLQVRATDGDGTIQTDVRREPFPDGATGRHTIVLTVS
jgi:DMSO/TMAO reductase YedYZ molybdopterin-dependent catalytic subunit